MNSTIIISPRRDIADVVLQKSLNNVMERMRGSIREHEKVMRGIKIDDSPY